MEKRDLYDINRNFTGKSIYKGEPIPEGCYINVVVIFIQNSEGKFLTQKRVPRKNGKYASTGGHPKAGETSIEGIVTEVKEELGLDINPDNLVLYFAGREDNEQVFYDDYYLKMDIDDLSKLQLQEDEVESVQWLSEEEIHNMMKEDKYFKNDYEEFVRLLDWLKGEKDGIK